MRRWRLTMGRGNLRKRTKGSWTLTIELPRDPMTGKRRQRYITVRGSKRLAMKHLAELHHQVDTARFVQPSKISLREFLQRWLMDYATAMSN